MFMSVNELKGLIVNLISFNKSTYKDWSVIASSIPCVFICRSNEPVLSEDIHPSSLIYTESNLVSLIMGFHLSVSECLKLLNLQPYEVAYVTNNPSELESMVAEAIGTILLTKQIDNKDLCQIPDFMTSSIEEIKQIISKEHRGYFGEVTSTKIGTVSFSNRGTVIGFEVECGSHKCQVFSSGRYYPVQHAKHNVHQLSYRILQSKKNNSQDAHFAGIFKTIIDFINKKNKIDGITRVPPRPGTTRDRLLPIVQRVCNNQYEDLSCSIECIENYDSQKTLQKEARMINVKGKFRALSNCKNKHIVLLDDIFATGATACECASTLLNAGASKVTIVVLGINQIVPTWTRIANFFPCPREDCDGNMKLRLNKRNQSAFYGCSNYFKGTCDKTLDFKDGWIRYNELNSMDNSMLEEFF